MKGVNIYPELGTGNKNKPCPIRIRFDMNRKHIGIDNIGYKIPLEVWDQEKKRVKSNYPNAQLINHILENRMNRHTNFILKREAFSLPINKEIISGYLQSDTAYEDFYEFSTKVLNDKRLKDGLPYSDDSKRRYNDEINRLKQFKQSLSFNQITVQFLEQYKAWLLNVYLKADEKKLSENSVWKALSFIRMVYNEAIKAEIILPDSNPFKTFKVGTYVQDPQKVKFLEVHQLDLIEQFLISTPGLPNLTINIGWRFLSMCVSGMRISDAMNLCDGYFNHNGNLEFTPHKTRRHKNVATIPISNDRQRRYFTETLQRPLPATDAKSFRTTFNIHLKIIAAAVGMHEINLTSHVGRHTMGGFLVDANIETRPAMAILGLKSAKTLETYSHLKEEKLKIEAAKLGNVM